MSNLTANQRLCKQPAEKRKFSMDFAALLSTSEVITTISSITSEEINGDTSDLIISGQNINGSKVEMFIESGTSGKTYRVEITVSTNGGQILQGDGILYVSDK
jgi:hypothetical protein